MIRLNGNLKLVKNNYYLFITLILIGILLRLLPHAPNMAPIGALALIASWRFSGIKTYIVPLGVLFLTDLYFGFHTTMPWVYGSYALIVSLGALFKQRQSLTILVSLALASSTLFFLITNFGVWITGELYPKTIQGLIECYTLALPFFRNTLLGDIFYSTLFYVLIKYHAEKIVMRYNAAICSYLRFSPPKSI